MKIHTFALRSSSPSHALFLQNPWWFIPYYQIDSCFFFDYYCYMHRNSEICKLNVFSLFLFAFLYMVSGLNTFH